MSCLFLIFKNHAIFLLFLRIALAQMWCPGASYFSPPRSPPPTPLSRPIAIPVGHPLNSLLVKNSISSALSDLPPKECGRRRRPDRRNIWTKTMQQEKDVYPTLYALSLSLSLSFDSCDFPSLKLKTKFYAPVFPQTRYFFSKTTPVSLAWSQLFFSSKCASANGITDVNKADPEAPL